MSESTWHDRAVRLAVNLLEYVYPDPSDVLIGSDQFLFWNYYEKGLVVSADLYVVKGVGRHQRSSYQTWAEGGKAPDVVFEFASETTWKNDQGGKYAIYEQALKVPEYFLVDATGRFVPERLRGYRLDDRGIYRAIAPADGRLESRELGLILLMEGDYLRFLDPQTGLLIPTPAEVEAERRQEQAARRQEEATRRQAEVKAAAEAEARRQAEAKAVAEAEARRQEEAARAVAEAKAAAEAEARRQEEAARTVAEAKAVAEAEARSVAEAKAVAEADARAAAEAKALAEAEARRQEADARAAAEEELYRLRAELQRLQNSGL